MSLDHTFDHLRTWTVWKQCSQEPTRASFSDSKVPKSLVNQGKNYYFWLWEQDVAGSNPVIPTKASGISLRLLLLRHFATKASSCFGWASKNNLVLFLRSEVHKARSWRSEYSSDNQRLCDCTGGAAEDVAGSNPGRAAIWAFCIY